MNLLSVMSSSIPALASFETPLNIVNTQKTVDFTPLS